MRGVRAGLEGLNLKAGLIEYLDPATYRGRMGTFRKYSDFEYQSEYRLALEPGFGKPYSLRVGDLSDIAELGDLDQVNDMIRVVPAGA